MDATAVLLKEDPGVNDARAVSVSAGEDVVTALIEPVSESAAEAEMMEDWVPMTDTDAVDVARDELVAAVVALSKAEGDVDDVPVRAVDCVALVVASILLLCDEARDELAQDVDDAVAIGVDDTVIMVVPLGDDDAIAAVAVPRLLLEMLELAAVVTDAEEDDSIESDAKTDIVCTEVSESVAETVAVLKNELDSMEVELDEAEGATETDGAEVSKDDTLALDDCVEDIDDFELNVDKPDEELVPESEGDNEITDENEALIECVFSAEPDRVPPVPWLGDADMHSESVDDLDECGLFVASEDIVNKGVMRALEDAGALSWLVTDPDGSFVVDPVEALVGASVDDTKDDFEVAGLSL